MPRIRAFDVATFLLVLSAGFYTGMYLLNEFQFLLNQELKLEVFFICFKLKMDAFNT